MNRSGHPGYHPGLQRHHLLPRELLTVRPFRTLFSVFDPWEIGLDDFHRNGLLLPASDEAARLLGLPLHRGPHRAYTAMVMERVGAIERDWAMRWPRGGAAARTEALFRIGLLQSALRRRLLAVRCPPLALNRQDPALRESAFADLDAMAEQLWGASAEQRAPPAGSHDAADGQAAPARTPGPGRDDQPLAALAALSTARTLAVATSSSIPTPQIVRPSAVTHST